MSNRRSQGGKPYRSRPSNAPRKRSRGRKGRKVIPLKDHRFDKIEHSALFQDFDDADGRIEVDDRFGKVLDHKNFQKTSKTDKLGRNATATKEKHFIERMYKRSGSDNKAQNAEWSSDEEDAVSQPAQQQYNGRDYDDDSSSESDSSDAESLEISPEMLKRLDEDVEYEAISAKRFSVNNIDWVKFTATDLMAMLQPFCPPSGRIISLTVYASEFGLKKMAEEESEMPDVLTDNVLDKEKLLQYHLDKQKYFYAIVTCSDEIAANAILNAADGCEIAATRNYFDLRVVPDDVDFGERQVRDTTDTVPITYRAPAITENEIYGKAAIDFTWEDDEIRDELKPENFDKYTEEELEKFIAPDSDEEECKEEIQNGTNC